MNNIIYNSHGKVAINELAAEMYLSYRQFHRYFKHYFGFTPKMYSRLVRFKRLLHNPNNFSKPLTQVAHEFGFYDESHFINEFKKFSGYTPGNYFSGKARDVFYEP